MHISHARQRHAATAVRGEEAGWKKKKDGPALSALRRCPASNTVRWSPLVFSFSRPSTRTVPALQVLLLRSTFCIFDSVAQSLRQTRSLSPQPETQQSVQSSQPNLESAVQQVRCCVRPSVIYFLTVCNPHSLHTPPPSSRSDTTIPPFIPTPHFISSSLTPDVSIISPLTSQARTQPSTSSCSAQALHLRSRPSSSLHSLWRPSNRPPLHHPPTRIMRASTTWPKPHHP